METPISFTDPRIVRESDCVVLYGAGTVGKDVSEVLCQAGVAVRCALDRRVRGTLGDVPVYSPDACPIPLPERERIPVVLSVFNRDVDVVALAADVRALGFHQIVTFVDLHHLFAGALGDRFWLTNRETMCLKEADIRIVEDLWADQESRDLYRGLVDLRRTGAYSEAIAPRAGRESYFRPGISEWLEQGPHRFADCGAYNGDTFEAMLSSGIRVNGSAHFEPDLENFLVLSATLARHRVETECAAFAWPCAVADRTGVVRFDGGQQEGSVISASGANVATAVALDDVLAGWRPTFVKMDIEGAEVEALRGASRLLSCSHPHLAICVYHRPDHLWEIPLLLSDAAGLDGYEYYLRAHGQNGFDTVLYARPRLTAGAVNNIEVSL